MPCIAFKAHVYEKIHTKTENAIQGAVALLRSYCMGLGMVETEKVKI